MLHDMLTLAGTDAGEAALPGGTFRRTMEKEKSKKATKEKKKEERR